MSVTVSGSTLLPGIYIYSLIAGTVLAQGLVKYPHSASDERYVKTVIGLTGDPLTHLWFKKPYDNGVENIFKPSSFTPNDSVYAAIFNFNNGESNRFTSKIGYLLAEERTENYSKLIFRSDMVPYIYPSVISGLNIGKDGYIFVGSLEFENQKDNGKLSLYLSNGAFYTIEALRDV